VKIGLLYCPEIAGFNSFGKTHWSSQIDPGLCSISAYAKSKGYEDIQLIDVRKLSGWEHFRKEVRQKELDVIGITMMSCDFNKAMKAISIIKQESEQAIVVAGGVHPTVAPEEVASNLDIDHVVTGEGEISFADLLDNIRRGKSQERVLNGIRPDLDELPFEDRELFDYKVTTSFVSNFPGIFKPPSVTMIASRGCPYNCTFCAPHAKTMFGNKIRYRSVASVIEELKVLRKTYQFQSLYFWDYSITMNKKWLYKFCQEYRRNGFKAKISANSRADAICENEDIMKDLADAGLKMVHIGFESGSQRILDFIKKGIKVEQSVRAAEICKRHGIIVRGLFMLGFPNERKEDVQQTVDLIRKIRPPIYSFSYFTPVPGSHLYDYCKERDLSLITSHEELANYGPSTPKIKGVDYDYLKKTVEEAFGLQFHSKLIGKFVRFIYTRARRGKVRYFFIWLYSRWVQFRGWIHA
jgi:radical SAM superfamily enzyme YgiQ (UPF0313 family)